MLIPALLQSVRTGGKDMASIVLSAALCVALLSASPLASAATDAAALDQAAEHIIRSLKPIHGNVDVARSGACTLRIDREFSGELATHQQVTVNLDAVTYASPGMTLGPKRNDEAYREIAKHRPYAIFFGSRSGAVVVHTETWFDPNPFRLARSFVDDQGFELYAETVGEQQALVQAVNVLATACRPPR